MSTVVPPMPSPAAPVGLSEPERVIDTFIAPSKTFEDLKRKESWWVPWLILAIIGLAVGIVLSKKVNWEQLVRQQIENGPRAAQFESLPKAQQDQQVAISAKVAGILVYGAPVFLLISGLVVAAVLMGVFNFSFDAGVPFVRSMAIVFYSWLPGIIHGALAVITLLLRSDTEGLNPNNLVASNLAYFLDKATTSKALYGLASAADVFTIWSIILMGIGFSINAAPKKLSKGTAIILILVIYVVIKVGFAAIGFGG